MRGTIFHTGVQAVFDLDLYRERGAARAIQTFRQPDTVHRSRTLAIIGAGTNVKPRALRRSIDTCTTGEKRSIFTNHWKSSERLSIVAERSFDLQWNFFD